MKKLVAILILASTLATNTAYAVSSIKQVRPIYRTNYIVVHDHDHSHTDEVMAGVMIGLGVALVIYAFTSEYRDPTHLTYRF